MPNSIAKLRKDLGLSQEQFAKRLGLSSKGHISQLERGDVTCSVETALKIEGLSEGRVPASSLNPDVALVERARGFAVAESRQ
jgi:transcriptional regulator with XRE-family HTH domain